jgi:hypothetical protein
LYHIFIFWEQANQTFHEMSRLRQFFSVLNTSVHMLHTNDKFRESFDGLVQLVRSPFVKALLMNNQDDIDKVEEVLNTILNDQVS